MGTRNALPSSVTRAPHYLGPGAEQPNMNSTNVREGDSLPGPIRSEAIIQLRRGRALGDVAREYGLSVSDLCQWIAETASAFEALTIVPEAEDDELTRLRRENECLRKQRDFYRKAAGIVSVDVIPDKWRADQKR